MPISGHLRAVTLVALTLLAPTQAFGEAAVPGSDLAAPWEETGFERPTGQADLELISSLSAPGWQSAPPVIIKRSGQELAASDGRPASELLGGTLPILVECKVQDIAVRKFQRGDRFCFAYIYRFASSEGAYAAYTNMRVGASTVVVRGDGSSEDENSISFWQGDSFVRLYTTSEDDEEAKDMLRSLALTIASRVGQPSGQLPALIRELPSLDKLKGSERLILGPAAARKHCSLPFASALSLELSRGAACADYLYFSPSTERLRLLVIDFGDSRIARSAFTKYTGVLRPDHKALEDTDYSFLCKVANHFQLCQLAGERMFVVSGARKKFSPHLLARQLARFQ